MERHGSEEEKSGHSIRGQNDIRDPQRNLDLAILL
jgi:hypothetical protein